MSFMRRLWDKICSIKLRTKLIISYVLLITIPIGIIGIKYYTTSTEIISALTRKNVYEIIKKNNQIIDARLSKIQEDSLNIMTDPVIYNTFRQINPQDNASLISADRDITPRLNIYFSDTADIYSSQLVTSYFVFGNNTSLLDNQNYLQSEVYKKAREGKGKLIWIPLYDFTKMFGHKELENIDLDEKYFFCGQSHRKLQNGKWNFKISG